MKKIRDHASFIKRKRYAILTFLRESLELLIVAYVCMVSWGVIAELSGVSPDKLILPGLFTTLGAIYLVGRHHNRRRFLRIKALYERVKADQMADNADHTDKSENP